jgi:hypothetical protein
MKTEDIPLLVDHAANHFFLYIFLFLFENRPYRLPSTIRIGESPICGV